MRPPRSGVEPTERYRIVRNQHTARDKRERDSTADSATLIYQVEVENLEGRRRRRSLQSLDGKG